MARTAWGPQVLTVTADLVKIEPDVASWGVTTIADKHTLAKDHIARELRIALAELKHHTDPKAEETNGATIVGTTFTAVGAEFQTRKVGTYDRIWIQGGEDEGAHAISSVTDEDNLEVTAAFVAAAGSLTWWIEPDVLDLIKNPLILTPAAVFLTLHYAALELVKEEGGFWDDKQKLYIRKYVDTLRLLIPDLLLDTNQDQVISSGERHPGIVGGGRFLR